MSSRRSAPLRYLLALAAVVVVLAGIKAAVTLLVPFLLAVFIAVIAGSPVYWLERHHVPVWVSIILVMVAVSMALLGIGLITGASVTQFLAELPEYRQRLRSLTAAGIESLGAFGVTLDERRMLSLFDPSVAFAWAGATLSGLTNALSNGFLILLTVVFILLEASSFPRKLREIQDANEDHLPRFERFASGVNRYMAIKTVVSALTGVTVAAALAVIGVSFPLLWGLLAFLLNYIPTIGSVIAAVPAVLLALIQLGPGEALLTAAAFGFANVLFGNVVEPRYMGQRLGLSTAVVFLSLVFWGYLLGPVGMLLSVPLTMTLKIALEVHPDTVWVAILLGPEQRQAAPTVADDDPDESVA